MLAEKQMELHKQELTALGFGGLWTPHADITSCTILAPYKPGKPLLLFAKPVSGGRWEEQRKEASQPECSPVAQKGPLELKPAALSQPCLCCIPGQEPCMISTATR